MLLSRFVVGILPVGLMVLGTGVVSGQPYPNKTIRIVTTAAGGSNDITARIVAQGISPLLNQPVVVENRAGGFVNAEIVSQSPADGYTVLVAGGTMWSFPLLQQTPYDPVKDFTPITLATSAPNILVVNPSLPANSIKELIALAKAKPGELNYASGPTGGPSHLTMELFKHMAGGVNIVRVGYKGGAAALIDVIAGRVQMTIDDAPTLLPNVKMGKLKALAITTAKPSAVVPGLPTVAASGVPGFEAAQMQGVFVPAKTPDAIAKRLNQEIVRFLRTPAAKETFFKAGTEPVGSSQAELAAVVKAEMDKLGKLIKDLGIRAN